MLLLTLGGGLVATADCPGCEVGELNGISGEAFLLKADVF